MSNVSTKLEHIVAKVVREGGSDLHISVGRHPTVRVTGTLIPLVDEDILTKEDVEQFIDELLSEHDKQEFLENKEADFSYEFGTLARFRGNAYFQQGVIGIALRLIPQEIKTIADLGLPAILEAFTRKKQGFFLVVGPVGQGKSTTLASMVELINQERAAHIVTIEDPVEYLFKEKRSIIEQREVGLDTNSFHSALRGAFRQDIDVIMIGEMRSKDTISTAVTAAETGHLVFSTLHTNDAAQTIDRIIDSFPAAQQAQIRAQLAGSLLGIFSQRLIPRISGGMVPAYELLINNHAVSSLIRDSRTHEINVVLETGLKDGMVSMNRSLADLVRRGEVSPDNAYLHSTNPEGLRRML